MSGQCANGSQCPLFNAPRTRPKIQIELFLSHYGVGVLSIALTPVQRHGNDHSGISPSEAIEFNYRLAQFQPWSAVKIRLPHPGDSAETLARLSDKDRANLRPAPPANAPLAERLGKRGGVITLPELVEELLLPLPLNGLNRKSVQSIFSVYAVARLGSDVDFALANWKEAVAPILSALAQVEEPDHAGSPPGEVTVPKAILNRRHWAAVGQQGAAHVIADQPDDHPFNEQRLPRVRDKYFIQYLMALLQRLVVHRVIDEAGTVLAKSGSDRNSTLDSLRADLLQFAVGGHFTQISSRHALHRFYRLARKGLDVPAAWTQGRRAIADLDAKLTMERQDEVADGVAKNLEAMAHVARDVDEVTRKMDKNLGIVAEVQRMVHYIEMFIVSVYCAHLWHMFADNESFKGLVRKVIDREWAGDFFVSLGVILWAAVGFGLVLVLGRVLHHRTGHRRAPDHPTSSSPNDLMIRLDLLELRLPELRDRFQRATRLISDDPEMALIRSRKVLEYVVRDVFVRRVKEPPGARPLENLIQRLVKDGHFPQRLEAYTETIRRLANISAHAHQAVEVTAADARTSLAHLLTILEWYASSIGSYAVGFARGDRRW
jgi:hypothetical protein